MSQSNTTFYDLCEAKVCTQYTKALKIKINPNNT